MFATRQPQAAWLRLGVGLESESEPESESAPETAGLGPGGGRGGRGRGRQTGSRTGCPGSDSPSNPALLSS